MRAELNVDTTDLKILGTLMKDARTPLYKIAQDCGLTSSAILKRIENLKAARIILGSYLWVKQDIFGYPYEASVGIRVVASRIEQVAEIIRQQPNVIVCTRTIGEYDLMCLIIAKSTREMDEVTQKIKSLLGVRKISINIWIEDSEYRPKRSEMECEKPDELDMKIINQLMTDCSMPYTKIAKKIGVSHETVRKRYERMKENHIIKGCSFVVDRSKLGYEGSVFFFITQSADRKKSKTMSELRRIDGLSLVTSVMGNSDILIHAYVRNLRDLAQLVDKIQKLPDVDRVDTCFATFTYFTFTPLPFSPIKCDTLELP